MAASDLIPEVSREARPSLAGAVFAGLPLFMVADVIVSGAGGH